MKTIILWTIIIVGELTGLFFVFLGIRKYIKAEMPFKLSHLSQNNPISKSSGTQLIIEGLFIMITGIAFYFVWFEW